MCPPPNYVIFIKKIYGWLVYGQNSQSEKFQQRKLLKSCIGSLVKSENCHRTASPPDLAHCAPLFRKFSYKKICFCLLPKNNQYLTTQIIMLNFRNFPPKFQTFAVPKKHTFLLNYLRKFLG